MSTINLFRTVSFAALTLLTSGCSSLGLSLFPTGHFLTEQAEEILQRSPRSADIARELSMDVEPIHFLQPGDVLLIEPVELDSDVRIPADQKVLSDGTVDLGGFGRLVIAGMTVEGAESLIEQTIVAGGEEATPINVRLLDPIHRYYVLGEVNSPGSYPLDGHESVLDGILAAGGLTSAAAPCKILLARPTTPNSCRVTLPVCYREITQMGDTTTNYQLRPGDRIFVATRSCCEELLFWQANKTCERCCKCQAACSDPNLLPTINPMGRVARSTGPIVVRDVLNHPNDGSFDSGDPATSGGDGAASATQSSPSDALLPPATVPNRLPLPKNQSPNRNPPNRNSPADGELEFDSARSVNRFEPMWVTPAER